MSKRILITGGAGFIGSHLSDELLEHGYKVRVLDSLLAQVHGMARDRPDYLNDRVELIKGDVRDKNLVRHALKGVDAVYHFAARVGVGQSMYEIKEYMEVNDIGTSVLLEVLSEHPTERLVIASSMSIYGEGMYRDSSSNTCRHVERNRKHMAEGLWEPMDEK